MKRLLVVDDDQVIAELFHNIFEAEDYEVISFSHLVDIETISLVKPDAILLDFLMSASGQTAWNLIQQLKLSQYTYLIPIVLCTAAQIQMYELDEALQQLGVAVVSKPFVIDNLVDVVEKELIAGRQHC